MPTSRFLTFLCVAALAACGTVAHTSDPVALGPEIYRIVTRASFGNENSSERQARDQAQAHCAKRRLETLVTNVRTQGNGAVELTYRCLAPDAPEWLNRRE